MRLEGVSGEKIPKCAPAERLPDGCLTFLLESPDSLQIFIRVGANKKSADSQGRVGFRGGLMYAAR